MKTLILALWLLVPASVLAQNFSVLPHSSFQMPKTVPLKDKATGNVIGTATISGTHIYFRDTKGRHLATIVNEPDGSRKAYDENGKPLERVPELPKDE